MTKQKIKIDIFSDINCPWCYVGERRLGKALQQVQDQYDAEINFKAFELNPNIPQDGMGRLEYFKGNYGEQILPQVPAMDQRMAEAGTEEGIRFNFSEEMTVNNTFNGHRLIWLAEQYEVQHAVANALFKAYFTEGRNMNDTAVLQEIGIAQGIPAERLEGFFESEEGKQEVREMEAFAQSAGITGVPAFVINDKFLVSGAQPAETFLNVFQQVAPSIQKLDVEGNSCGVDGIC
ncbi:DsbA family oxidoreductase [Pontibacter sp. JH31]|uniref:DsbA family oxidoreductase n=1 Tax=Pontibacter aquaedesilientis TaxID=2766980 RepID=A0ABR7XBP1_9BACT|nr:DsbA family oxidoreductase [Pontibacter aquaedesilientis]MBD1395707.1 DsbA family oxidoreductase [Pontibacter aquaedesilientis]